jgi:hypothetical protein
MMKAFKVKARSYIITVLFGTTSALASICRSCQKQMVNLLAGYRFFLVSGQQL